jgi:hypothetical protein
MFTDWPSTSTTPTGYGATLLAGTTLTKETTLCRVPPNAARFTVTGTGNGYLTPQVAPFAGFPNLDYATATIDFMLVSGDLSSAGAIVRWTNSVATLFDAQIKLSDYVPNPILNKWYRVTKTVQRPATFTGTFASMSAYVMGAYGLMATVTPKDIIFDQFAVRAATNEEVLAYNAASATALASKVRWMSTPPVNGTTLGNVGDLIYVKTGATTIDSIWECTTANNWTQRYVAEAAIGTLSVGKITGLSATLGTLFEMTPIPTLTSDVVNGLISWPAFTIKHGGVTLSVPLGSTANSWVIYRWNAGAPFIEQTDPQPTMGVDDFILFSNNSGIGIRRPDHRRVGHCECDRCQGDRGPAHPRRCDRRLHDQHRDHEGHGDRGRFAGGGHRDHDQPRQRDQGLRAPGRLNHPCQRLRDGAQGRADRLCAEHQRQLQDDRHHQRDRHWCLDGGPGGHHPALLGAANHQ